MSANVSKKHAVLRIPEGIHKTARRVQNPSLAASPSPPGRSRAHARRFAARHRDRPGGEGLAARLTEPIHPTRSHGAADLYHSAPLIVNYVFTVLKRTPQLPWSSDTP